VTALVEAGICGASTTASALGDFEISSKWSSLRSRFEVLRREDERRLRAIGEYANETGCRSQMLRRYFGDIDPRPCGRCDLCRTNGVGEVARGRRRRRRRGGERGQGGHPGHPGHGGHPGGGEQPRPTPMAAAPRPSRAQGFHLDPNDRRRRRRRRGRRGPDDVQAPKPSEPLAPPPLTLEPMDSAADELAAELGAPGLPPMDSAPPAAVVADGNRPDGPRPEGGRRRRRRRRRRGHGPRPADVAPTAQT
jgi:hypothetical protein